MLCYPNRTQLLAGGRSAEQLYERTMERQWVLRKSGEFHAVYTIWECKFKEALRRNASLLQIYNQIWIPPVLHPRRHCLRGGRVEPFLMYHKCSPDETIDYYDIVFILYFCGLIKKCSSKYINLHITQKIKYFNFDYSDVSISIHDEIFCISGGYTAMHHSA